MKLPETNFETLKRVFLLLGIAGLLISCSMTWKYGSSISWTHGFALVSVTIAAAFMFPVREMLRNAGAHNAGRVILACGCFFVGLEFLSDLAYTIGMRDKTTVEAGAQNATYAQAQASIASETANLSMWRKQLATLQEQNSWAGSVKADGLRAQLAVAQKAIDLEAGRGGCKAKCLAEMEKKGKLEKDIATAEQASDLTARIEATQRILDKKTDVGAHTQVGHSAVKKQNDAFASVGLMILGSSAADSLHPDEVSLSITDMVIGFLMALGATFLPTASFYIAFFTEKIERMKGVVSSPAPRVMEVQPQPQPQPQQPVIAYAPPPPPPAPITNTIVRTIGGIVHGRSLNGGVIARHIQPDGVAA